MLDRIKSHKGIERTKAGRGWDIKTESTDLARIPSSGDLISLQKATMEKPSISFSILSLLSTGFEPDQYQISVQMYGKITTEAVYNIMTA
jgi:hypothetical protein